MELIEFVLQRLNLIFIIFSRLTGFFAIVPIFGRRNFPTIAKIVLAFFCSLIILPIINLDNKIPDQILPYAAIILKEFFIGFIIGFCVFLMFTAIYVAGQLIDMKIGFGIVNVLDPQINIQVPIMGNFQYIITMLIFLTINGHHLLLDALIKSYTIISIGEGFFSEAFFEKIIEMFSEMFLIAFKISLPVIGAVFLADVALGIVARTVPQMNVFIVGLPIKVALGIFVMVFYLPMYLIIIDVMFNGAYNNIFSVIRAMLL